MFEHWSKPSNVVVVDDKSLSFHDDDKSLKIKQNQQKRARKF